MNFINFNVVELKNVYFFHWSWLIKVRKAQNPSTKIPKCQNPKWAEIPKNKNPNKLKSQMAENLQWPKIPKSLNELKSQKEWNYTKNNVWNNFLKHEKFLFASRNHGCKHWSNYNTLNNSEFWPFRFGFWFFRILAISDFNPFQILAHPRF